MNWKKQKKNHKLKIERGEWKTQLRGDKTEKLKNKDITKASPRRVIIKEKYATLRSWNYLPCNKPTQNHIKTRSILPLRYCNFILKHSVGRDWHPNDTIIITHIYQKEFLGGHLQDHQLPLPREKRPRCIRHIAGQIFLFVYTRNRTRRILLTWIFGHWQISWVLR